MELDWKDLELELLLSKFNVVKRAETDGSNDVPASDDQMSSVENELIAFAKSHYDLETGKNQKTVLEMEETIKKCLSLTKSNGHSQLFGAEKQNWMGVKTRLNLAIDVANKHYIASVSKLRAFRIANSILSGRETSVRTSWMLVIACMIPILMASVEMFLNFEVLRPIIGSQAIPYSLIVSVVNIGFAFFAGRMIFTNLMHPVATSSSKASYFALLFFILCLMVYVNLFMGVLRGATADAQLDFSDLGQMKLAMDAALYNAVLPWNHFDKVGAGSVQLFLIAITFSFFSMIDGYFFDDPINGYGSLGRKQARAQGTLSNLLRDGEQSIDDFITQANSRLKTKSDDRHRGNDLWDRTTNHLDAANKTVFPRFNSNLKVSLLAAVNSYRTKNKLLRATPLPDFMMDPIDTSFIQSFDQEYSDIAYHLLSDPERVIQYSENEKLINHEYEQTVDSYQEFFKSEHDEVAAKIREIEIDD